MFLDKRLGNGISLIPKQIYLNYKEIMRRYLG